MQTDGTDFAIPMAAKTDHSKAEGRGGVEECECRRAVAPWCSSMRSSVSLDSPASVAPRTHTTCPRKAQTTITVLQRSSSPQRLRPSTNFQSSLHVFCPLSDDFVLRSSFSHEYCCCRTARGRRSRHHDHRCLCSLFPLARPIRLQYNRGGCGPSTPGGLCDLQNPCGLL